jgi:hypothetical protein
LVYFLLQKTDNYEHKSTNLISNQRKHQRNHRNLTKSVSLLNQMSSGVESAAASGDSSTASWLTKPVTNENTYKSPYIILIDDENPSNANPSESSSSSSSSDSSGKEATSYLNQQIESGTVGCFSIITQSASCYLSLLFYILIITYFN